MSDSDIYDYRHLIFYVNGKRIDEEAIDPLTTLADYLRNSLRLTGTKIGCNEGGCGACIVMISDIDPSNQQIRHYSAYACLIPICSIFGKAITTVEGLGSVVDKKLHPIQERLSKAHGSQCGFCTPGFVMAMYSLLRNNPSPTEIEVDEALQGNLCRCTGYRPILESFYSFCEDQEDNGCPMGERCCRNKERGASTIEAKKLTVFDSCRPYDPTQEIIFPPELKLKNLHQKSFVFKFGGMTWYQPTQLSEALKLKQHFPHARLISGNTEIAIQTKFKFIEIPVAINLKQIAEIRDYKILEDSIYLGAGLSLTEVKQVLRKFIADLPSYRTAILKVLDDFLYNFAYKHIRNIATIAGNIINASPISNLIPIWMASGAKVHLKSASRGSRIILLNEEFFKDYHQTSTKSEEILIGIEIPLTTQNQHFQVYKQSQHVRFTRENDAAVVTGAFLADIDPDTRSLKTLKMSFGGMGKTPKSAIESVKNIQGGEWNETLLENILEKLQREFELPLGVPGGMSRYRQSLVLSFFFKFFYHVLDNLQNPGPHSVVNHPSEPFTSTQIFQDVPSTQLPTNSVGRPLAHLSGEKHATGEAIYSSDLKVSEMLYMALVLSPAVCGTITSTNIAKAMEIPGVIAYINHSDIPGDKNIAFGEIPIFVIDKVEYYGQPIGAIIAKSHEIARRAAAMVEVKVDAVEKVVVTIEEAKNLGHYFNPSGWHIHSSLGVDHTNTIPKSDWSKYKTIIQGTARTGAQEHFYLETNNCTVIPLEDDELEVISSTQCVDMVQRDICAALGLPQHKVVVKVRRVGGGFGGKETMTGMVAAAAAIGAVKLRKPIQLVLERFDDMAITGTRHPFYFEYKLALDENNKFIDTEITAYSNAGCTLDLSGAVMGILNNQKNKLVMYFLERCLTSIDNTYKFGNADFHGYVCKTNGAPNTGFRGFGGPQGMFCMETMIKHAAEVLKIDVDELRIANMYSESDCTPFGMHLTSCNAQRCWDECISLSDYPTRKQQILNFNKTSRFKKRGIYIIPTKFGIGFGFKPMNQAGALIHIYTDGTVLISHGGMEMGQGLHTKMLQVASRCLGIPVDLIHLENTSTDKIPNASPTAASASSDMYGLAIQNASEELLERLRPFKEAHPTGKWSDWVMAAYVNRISLSATGFGLIHYEDIDFNTGKGSDAYGYCVYGACCAEVEVDCLTGDHQLLRSDIVMDIGDSLNPAIDIGQIEGAFVQGYGLFTMEEIRIRPNGIRLTRGPSNYQIPAPQHAPRHFNVKLLKGSSNKSAIFSSKAVGEPPLFLGATVFFAIREAIKSYREDQGHQGYFKMDAPATAEKIRMLCEDSITSKLPEMSSQNDSFIPWVVDQ